MSTPEEAGGTGRQFLAALAGTVVGIGGLVIWYKLKVSVLPSWWGGVSFFFMPAVMGICVGLTMRWLRHEGTFGLAGLAVLITAIVGLTGLGMQHWLNVNKRLQQLADTAYDETVEFAKTTTSITNETQLRQVLTNSAVAAVGRLAAREPPRGRKEFWFWRNYIHLHWVATRQIIIYGQGGADKTIWEATRIFPNGPFVDDVIRGMSREPLRDDEVVSFQQRELPWLRKVADGDITREEFKSPVIAVVRTEVNDASLPVRGFDPFSGICLAAGCLAAFALVRQASQEEMI